jgi:putative transposase
MPFNPLKHDRRSQRLNNYDYSHPGSYFVTLCVADRKCIFGEVVDEKMRLNEIGMFVAEQLAGLPKVYLNTAMDEFVIMPNHIHAIIQIADRPSFHVGAGFQPAQPRHQTKPDHGLPEIIRGFKTYTSRIINRTNGTPGNPVWQRNYYEHVVRAGDELDRIRQ